jgi:selenocysteine lyase/cysteine desulfurase
LGVDWYVFSTYKVYGPHLAVLAGRREAFADLKGPNHSFVEEGVPYKWELGGPSHEACSGLTGLKTYFSWLGEGGSVRSAVDKAFLTARELERPLEELLRDWLSKRSDVKIIGPSRASDDTVGTVSFIHDRLPSDFVAAEVNRRDIGIRHGNVYAVRLLEGLGIPADPGVVRVSMVHYNTTDEIERLIEVFDSLFTNTKW